MSHERPPKLPDDSMIELEQTHVVCCCVLVTGQSATHQISLRGNGQMQAENVQKNNINVGFSEKELSAVVKLPSGEDYSLKLSLIHPIVPEQSTFKILSTKIEMKMKKSEAVRWEKLEGQRDVPRPKQFTPYSKHMYPSSSYYIRNWDKLVGEIKEEEKNEKLRDLALNKLFQQIYSDGFDEVKHTMNKSFMESGGTVLSTNCSDVGKRKVDVNPPDDMEWEKF
ncbi:protein SGT1 homolog [Dromiciops gliroides]|uniref:protein SGT1 homolog n=1 Tax=Dromiciops gliroides TaxID=33562 RepID=UPI001CC4BFD0|nr:protein SGT1 homolog [Dromiciops gliroides]